MRKAYGKALVEIGKENPDVIVLSADVSSSDQSYMFEENFPDRFFNVGIAEQALVDISVGFALDGKIPVANTFAFLFATRALEPIRTHLCFGVANVKLAAAYAGLSDSFDGPTHHSLTDLAIMRSLPNMLVVVPSDAVSVRKLLNQVIDHKGPVYFRLCRNELPVIHSDAYEPELGKGVPLREGKDISLIACGVMVSRALEAALQLEKEGIDAGVVEIHTLKPLDRELIQQCASTTGHLVTIEEHSIIGGLGSAVSDAVSAMTNVRTKAIGIQDRFTETGPYNELLDKFGFSIPTIVETAKDFLAK
jgi:transketolase